MLVLELETEVIGEKKDDKEGEVWWRCDRGGGGEGRGKSGSRCRHTY